MSGWREIKAQAKAVVHSTFEVPAIYLTHVEGISVPCSVRVHTKVTTTENEFTWPSHPGYLEIDPYVIFDAAEVPAPLAKSYVIVSDTEIYRIGVAEPARENFIKAQVSVLNPAECAALVAAITPVEP